MEIPADAKVLDYSNYTVLPGTILLVGCEVSDNNNPFVLFLNRIDRLPYPSF